MEPMETKIEGCICVPSVEQRLAAAERRIAELEAVLRRLNDAATVEGNDPRNPPDTRTGFRAMGAVIRKEMAQLGL